MQERRISFANALELRLPWLVQLRLMREQTKKRLIACWQGTRFVILDQFQVSYELELRILMRSQDVGLRPSVSDPANSGDLCWLVLHYSDVTWAFQITDNSIFCSKLAQVNNK